MPSPASSRRSRVVHRVRANSEAQYRAAQDRQTPPPTGPILTVDQDVNAGEIGGHLLHQSVAEIVRGEAAGNHERVWRRAELAEKRLVASSQLVPRGFRSMR